MDINALPVSLAKLTIGAVVLFMSGAALAEPALQVDIDGGTYDATDEDVITSDSTFTVLALCDTAVTTQCTDGGLGEYFFVSISLRDADGEPVGDTNPDLGSILVNGEEIDVTGEMVYGTPPLEDYWTQAFDPGDLSPHGAFPTYFYEVAVDFNGDDTCGAPQYNVQNTPGNCDRAGSASYFYEITVDASNLEEGYGLHFDLYNASAFIAICETTRPRDCTSTSGDFLGYDIDLEKGDVANAPFSKDASYRCCKKVTEPGTLGLLGIGLLGLGLTSRRRLFA